jgi:hypothetical protein
VARSRNIKPGFFKNYDLADLGPVSQLLFAGLWCLADRDGRLEDKPRLIKAELFPYYDCDVNGELTKLARLKFVDRYVVDGEQYIQIENFQKHQQPHHTEKKSIIPERTLSCCNSDTPDIHGEVTVNIPLIPDSLLLIPDSLIPEEKTCAEPEESGPSPAVLLPEIVEPAILTIPLIKRDGNFNITQIDIDQWQDTFQAVDVLQALKEIRQWNTDNPAKRKTAAGIRGHITRWLGGEQNRPRRAPPQPGTAIRANTVHQAQVLENDAMARNLLRKKYGDSDQGNSGRSDPAITHPLQISQQNGSAVGNFDG